MKRPQHSGHPPWGKPLHPPVTPAASATVWRGLYLKLTPKGKRFRMGELVAGEFTLPASLNLRNYRVQLNYTQLVVSREAEQVSRSDGRGSFTIFSLTPTENQRCWTLPLR